MWGSPWAAAKGDWNIEVCSTEGYWGPNHNGNIWWFHRAGFQHKAYAVIGDCCLGIIFLVKWYRLLVCRIARRVLISTIRNSLLRYSSIFHYFFLIFDRRIIYYIIQRQRKGEAPKRRGRISAFLSVAGCWMSSFSATKISLLRYSSIFHCCVLIFYRDVDWYIIQRRLKREAPKRRGRIRLDILQRCRLMYYSGTTEMRGSETQRQNFSIHF